MHNFRIPIYYVATLYRGNNGFVVNSSIFDTLTSVLILRVMSKCTTVYHIHHYNKGHFLSLRQKIHSQHGTVWKNDSPYRFL